MCTQPYKGILRVTDASGSRERTLDKLASLCRVCSRQVLVAGRALGAVPREIRCLHAHILGTGLEPTRAKQAQEPASRNPTHFSLDFGHDWVCGQAFYRHSFHYHTCCLWVWRLAWGPRRGEFRTAWLNADIRTSFLSMRLCII